MGDATDALEIEVSRPFEHVVLVVLTGEIDILSSADLASRLAVVASEPAVSVVVDLAGITFIDSSGIHALVNAVRTAERNGGSAVLAAPAPGPGRVFEITRLADVVPVERTREQALARRFIAAPPRGPEDEPL